VYDQGAGRVDDDRATRQAVSTEPPSVSFGEIPFPHDQDPPSVRTVHYQNDGSAPVTLALAATLTGPDGSTTPGMVSVAPASITVPAGGGADATVTINTQLDAPLGVFGGSVVATSGDLRVITPIGIDREAAAFKLKVEVLDHKGQPVKAELSVTGVGPFGSPIRDVSISEHINGQKAFHLLAGTYTITAFINSKKHPILMIAPRVDLSRNLTVSMDGELAKPLNITLPDDDLTLIGSAWSYQDNANFFSFFDTETDALLRTAQIGVGTGPGEAESFVQAAYVNAVDAPTVVYNLAHHEDDQFLTGWKQNIKARELANVIAHHAGRDDRQYVKSAAALVPGGGAIFFIGSTYTGPFDRTEHFFGPDFQWGGALAENIPPATPGGFALTATQLGQTRAYLPGQTYTEGWNQAAYGATFPGPSVVGFGGSAQRTGVLLNLGPSLATDVGEPGRASSSSMVSEQLTLFENGTKISQTSGPFSPSIFANVGSADADFRLDADLVRPAATFDLSTHVTASWSFHSAPAATTQILPLPSLRFAPPLDAHNRTAAAAVPLPIHVARPIGAPTPKIATITVDASFDDGATWTPVPVAMIGDDAIGIVTHAPGASFVSLRGHVVDVDGNAADQTIIRAYGLTP
jgi:hypothetical protein